MTPNPLNPRIIGDRILTDRGIRAAITAGLIKIDPPLEGKQLQPASIDFCLDHIEVDGPSDENGWKKYDPRDKQNPTVLYPNCNHEIHFTQHIEFPIFHYLVTTAVWLP